MRTGLFTLFFILFFTHFSLMAQENWGKPFESAETAYGKGDYLAALKALSKAPKVIVKTNDKALEAWMYTLEAKYKDGVGKFGEMNEKLNQSVAMLNQLKDANPQTALAWLNVSKGYSEFGNYGKAITYILKAKEIADNTSIADTSVRLAINIQLADMYYHLGDVKKCLDLIPKLLPDAQYVLTIRSLPYTFIKKGKTKTGTRKLSKFELAQNKAQFASLLLIRARALDKKGDYTAADGAYNDATSWASREIGAKSFAFSKARFYQVKMREDETEEDDNIREYKKIKGYAGKSSFLLTSKFSVELHASLLHQYYLDEQKNKPEDVLDDLEYALKKYYHKNTIYEELIDGMKIDRDVVNGRDERAFEKLTKLYVGKRGKAYAEQTKKMQSLMLQNMQEMNKYLQNVGMPDMTDLGLYGIPDDHPFKLQILTNSYRVNLSRDNFTQANLDLINILRIKKILYTDQYPEWNFAMLDLADFYINGIENLTDAEKIFDENLPVIKEQTVSSNKLYLKSLTNLAKLYDYTDRYQKSIVSLQEAIATQKKNGEKDNLSLAKTLSALSAVQIRAALYKDAEANIETSLKIFKGKRAFRRTLDYARALQTKAKLYTVYGLYKEAEDLLDDSEDKSITKRVKKNVSVKSLEDIALLKIKLEKYDEVQAPLTLAISGTEARYKTNVHRNLIAPLNYRAILNLDKGDYVEAEKDIKRASDIATKLFGVNSDRYSECLVTSGQVNAELGDYEKAEQNFRKAIAIITANRGENNILSVDPMMELAEVRYAKNKNVKEAEQTLNQAKEIVAKSLSTDSPLYAEVSRKLANIYIEADKLDQALVLLNDANTIWIKKVGKSNKNTADVLAKRADIFSKKKDFKNAETNYESAKSMYKDIFNDRHPSYKKVVGKLGRMYYIKGDYKKSLTSLDESTLYYQKYLKKTFPSLSEGQKAKFWNSIKNDFEFFNTLIIKQKDEKPELLEKMYNFQLSTKAILLSSSVKVRERILNSADTLLKSQYQEWVNKKELLNTALSLNTQQIQDNHVDIDKIEADIDELEKKLSEKSETFAKSYDTKNYTWENVKSNLAANETAIEMIRFRYYTTAFSDSIIYAALVVTPQTKKNPDLVILANGNELETKYLKFHRNNIRLKKDEVVSYKQFWQPLEKAVKSEKVFLSPDGVYNQINPSAIRMPDGKYVIDKYNILTVSNTKDLIVNKLKKRVDFNNKNAVFVGNPIFYASADSTVEHSIDQLPGAEEEVRDLFELTKKQSGWKPVEFLENDEGTDEESIKKLSNKRIVHFATHGFFLEDSKSADELESETNANKASKNPLFRSGLILKGGGDVLAHKEPGAVASENGILTAYEAMNLNFDETELVVLSACETGLGEVQVGEGVFGLQRAFIVAGADAVIMSLFKVSDEVTREMMNKFYEKWFKTGNKRSAFLQAQKEIKEKYQYPIYWGAFNMIGTE